jgi:hypothetical protein
MAWADSALEARVRRLDGDGLTAFVADLWAARGFETARDGASVTARRGGETRVIHVPTRSAAGASVGAIRDADVVVTAGGHGTVTTPPTESEARVRDAADLTEMLRYAVPRDAAADLCETHFGAAPGELRAPPRRRLRRAAAGVELRTVAAVVVLLTVVAGAGAVLGPAGPVVDGGGTPAEAAVASETPSTTGSDDPATATAGGGSTPTGAGVAGGVPVAGVTDTGIGNASRLARAHAAAVSNAASYTIRFDYYAPASGSEGQPRYDADVRVQRNWSAVENSLERPGGNRVLLSTVYANETGRYRADVTNARFVRIDNRTPTATPRAVPFTRPTTMVRTYLATPETSVRVAETDAAGDRYRLRGTGSPAALPDTVSEYEMTAIVDERGFVRTFEAEFSVPREGDGVGGRERVRLTWTYDRVNATEVRTDPGLESSTATEAVGTYRADAGV